MDDEFILIKGVRVSFPHLFTKPIINGQEAKCGAQLMLDRNDNDADIAKINKTIADLVTARLKGRKPSSDKLCLRDGADKGRPEYEGYQVLSANSKTRPVVLAVDGKTQIHSEEDNRIYAGCYVNAKVRLWAQDNNYGKRINAELVAIQFAKDGEPLDGSYVSPEEAASGFGEIEDDDFLAA